MSFKRGIVRCNYCRKVIRKVLKRDWWVWADNTQVHVCAECKEKV